MPIKTYYLGIVVIIIILAIVVIRFQPLTPIPPEIKGEITPSEISEEIKTLPDGTKFLVHPSNILSGGPPKGGIGVDIGIPAINNPKFIPASEADFLSDEDIVLGLEYKGVERAYPFKILVFHEIVNDEINGEPILVTECPLCLTGIAFKRTIDGQVAEFGTSGKLWNANLVMYDTLTDSYWSQVSGKAIVGELTGTKLERIPIDTVRWKDWLASHPNTEVLSTDTGFFRSYGADPYGSVVDFDLSGYYGSAGVGFGVGATDPRLHAKALIHGVEIGNTPKAYPREEVKKAGLVNDVIEGKEILALYNPDTGVVKIFDRTFDGEVLEFEIQNGKLFDSLGNEWDFDGQSPAGELTRIDDTFGFWFSWAKTYPDTELFTA